jgi:hypothetical protein
LVYPFKGVKPAEEDTTARIGIWVRGADQYCRLSGEVVGVDVYGRYIAVTPSADICYLF